MQRFNNQDYVLLCGFFLFGGGGGGGSEAQGAVAWELLVESA